MQSAATTRLIGFSLTCNSLGNAALSQSNSRNSRDEFSAVVASSIFRWTISCASGRSVSVTLAFCSVCASAMPTIPQPVPSSRILSVEPGSWVGSRVFDIVLAASERGDRWHESVIPASLLKLPSQRRLRWSTKSIYHRCLAMLSPVSSQILICESSDSCKRLSTSFAASDVEVKGGLHADTTPRAPL